MSTDAAFDAVSHSAQHAQLLGALQQHLYQATIVTERLMAHRADNPKAVNAIRLRSGDPAAQRMADRLQHDSALARTLLETLSGTELGRLISQYGAKNIGAYRSTTTAA